MTSPPRTSGADGVQAFAGPRPEQVTYVVGDVHGRSDLLEPIFSRIDAHIGTVGAMNPKLVFVGDYVDYGPDSRNTLLRLAELTGEFSNNVVCLMGNHERMLLDFLADPVMRAARWLRAGGLQTLASFGIGEPERSAEGYTSAAAALSDAMGKGLRDWIEARPLAWHSRDLWVVHAAADPRHEMAAQSARVLMWGHPEFDVVERTDGNWVVHGHTIVPEALFEEGRINVDTGAWETGRLTAAAISPFGEVEFLTVHG